MLSNKNKISIIWRILSPIALAVLMFSLIFGYFENQASSGQNYGKLRKNLSIISDQLTIAIAQPLKNNSNITIDRLLENVMNYEEVYGVVLKPVSTNMSIVIRARDEQWNSKPLENEFEKNNLMEEKRNILIDNINYGELKIYASSKFIRKDASKVTTYILINSLIIVLFIFAIGYFLIKHYTIKPLNLIKNYLKNYEKDNTIINLHKFSSEFESFRTELINLSVLMGNRVKQLQDSEELLQETLKMTPLPLCITNFSGNLVYVNNKFTEVFGYTIEDVPTIAEWWMRAYTSENDRKDAALYWAKIIDIVKLNKSQIPQKTNKIICKDKSQKSIEEFRIGVGSQILTIYNDISDRKRAEENIISERENFYKIFSAAPIGLVLLNSDGVINQVNKAFCKILQKEPYELLWKDFRSALACIHGMGNMINGCGAREACAGCFFKNKFELIAKGETQLDGAIVFLPLIINNQTERKWLKISLETVSINNQANYIIAIEDITNQKQAEIALLKSEEKFSKAFNNSPVAFVISTLKDSVILNVNDTFESVLGFKRSEAIGKSFNKLYIFENIEDWTKIQKDLSNNDWISNQEIEFRNKKGELITCLFSLDSIEIDGVACVLGVFVNISARKYAEEELRKSQSQLVDFAAHLQNVREEERVYLSRELHDNLGQNLTAIRMYAFRIMKKMTLEISEEDLDASINQMKEMINAVDSTIQLTRKISRELRPVVIEDLGLLAAIEWQAEEFTKLSEIECKINSNIEKIDLETKHALAIFRIIQEALTNIIRHSSADLVNININKSLESLVIEIVDNGIGINEVINSNKKNARFIRYERKSISIWRQS